MCLATIGEHRMSKTIPRSFTGGGKSRVAAVYQVLSEHQPEVAGEVDRELHKGEHYGPYVGYSILRSPSSIDVPSRSFVGEDGDFREEASGTAEMMCGRCGRNTRFLGRRTKRKAFNAFLGDDLVSGLDQRCPKITMMVAVSFFRSSDRQIILTAFR